MCAEPAEPPHLQSHTLIPSHTTGIFVRLSSRQISCRVGGGAGGRGGQQSFKGASNRLGPVTHATRDVVHGLHCLEAQLVGVLLRGRLRVDADNVFRARRPHEAPSPQQ